MAFLSSNRRSQSGCPGDGKTDQPFEGCDTGCPDFGGVGVFGCLSGHRRCGSNYFRHPSSPFITKTVRLKRRAARKAVAAQRFLAKAVDMLKRAIQKLGLFVRSYAGAGGGRRWRGQAEMPVMLSAMHAARGPLARRTRYLAGSNPLAASGVEAWVSGLVGTGIKPQSAHADPSVRSALNLSFENWTDEADADGLTDFYGLQAIMVRRMVIDGEAFAVLGTIDGRLRIRLVDPEQVDPSLNRELIDGSRIVQGVEFDAAGRRVAYHVLPERPGMPFAHLPLNATRVPADDVVHMLRPEVPGQVRGVSWFAPVLLRIADLDSWRDSQLVRQKVAAALAGFVTNSSGTGAPFEGEQTGAALIGGLEPGTIKFLDAGQDIKFSTPADIGGEVIDFAKITEREIAVGLGLPAWILTGDLSQANYGSQRGGLVEFRRRIEALQHGVMSFQLIRPVWRRWATLEVLSGRASGTVEAALPMKAITPRQPWIDPAKDIRAEIEAIEAGIMSRREAVTARGLDIEALDIEIAADRTRAAALGLDFTTTKTPNTDAGNADSQQA
ncbi:phage portal protein [Rhodopseudomonas sp. NSM]|uniref:phage portal protein n=1 Tax=Rhodopseudomonas sp. NSM TaxID=3457630 RepID=UPI0040368E56